MVGQHHRGHGFEETDAPLDAITAAMPTPAPGTAANAEAFEPHRVAPLQDFWIREARIRHVRLDRIRSVEVRSGARTPGDGLVVLVLRIAEGEVVHGALRA